MARDWQKVFPIERTEGEDGSFEESHPAYGMIGVWRTSGRATLFGSELPSHDAYMTIKVVRARRRYNLGRDWIFGEHASLIEVHLSAAQWVAFISTPNTASGVPCTLSQVMEGEVIHYAQPPLARTETESVRKQMEGFAAEIKPMMRDARSKIEAALNGKVSKKVLDEVMGQVSRVERELSDHIPFLNESLREAAEKTVATAKSEVDAFVQSVAMKFGFATMRALKDSAKAKLNMIEADPDQDEKER